MRKGLENILSTESFFFICMMQQKHHKGIRLSYMEIFGFILVCEQKSKQEALNFTVMNSCEISIFKKLLQLSDYGILSVVFFMLLIIKASKSR